MILEYEIKNCHQIAKFYVDEYNSELLDANTAKVRF